MRLGDGAMRALVELLQGFGLTLRPVEMDRAIPGSYWGGTEAGLRGATVFARADTPVHSVLHETSHVICMTPERRAQLDTDAGGDELEEMAVCYLQICLGARLPGIGKDRLFHDMDAWGYSFRLGSARAWFEADADDARTWLLTAGLIDRADRPTGRCRASPSRSGPEADRDWSTGFSTTPRGRSAHV